MANYCLTIEGNNQPTDVQYKHKHTHTHANSEMDDSHCKCQDQFTSAKYHSFQGHKSSLSEFLSVHLARTDRPVLDQAYFNLSADCYISGKLRLQNNT